MGNKEFIVLSYRSAAMLAMGDISEALEDAKEALTLAPKYPEVCHMFILIVFQKHRNL